MLVENELRLPILEVFLLTLYVATCDTLNVLKYRYWRSGGDSASDQESGRGGGKGRQLATTGVERREKRGNGNRIGGFRGRGSVPRKPFNLVAANGSLAVFAESSGT